MPLSWDLGLTNASEGFYFESPSVVFEGQRHKEGLWSLVQKDLLAANIGADAQHLYNFRSTSKLPADSSVLLH